MTLTVGILQGGANSHETSSEEANAIATDFVTEGVVGTITNTSGVAPATGGFAVNAQGTPNMTVAVSAGTAYVTGTPTSGNSQTVRVKNSASANVTITANSTGGTRYDWIYIKLDPDKLKDPAADASDVATLVASRSTSASTDNGTPPTYGYCLAVVTVSNGASSITNGNITDNRISTGASGTGAVIQVVTATYSAVATGTTTMPYDDTIPQNTEGNQIMTLAITPKSATNLLVIEVNAQLAHSAITDISAALFQDSTANALAAGEVTEETANFVRNVPILHRMVAGTTSSTTFNVRAGGSNAGTLTFNGTGGNRRFGGITTSWIKITEIKA